MMATSYLQGGTLTLCARSILVGSFDYHRFNFLKGAIVRPFYLSQIRHVTTRNNMRTEVTERNRG